MMREVKRLLELGVFESKNRSCSFVRCGNHDAIVFIAGGTNEIKRATALQGNWPIRNFYRFADEFLRQFGEVVKFHFPVGHFARRGI